MNYRKHQDVLRTNLRQTKESIKMNQGEMKDKLKKASR